MRLILREIIRKSESEMRDKKKIVWPLVRNAKKEVRRRKAFSVRPDREYGVKYGESTETQQERNLNLRQTHKIHGKMRENEGFDLSLLFCRSKTEQKKEYTNATPQTAKAL